MLLSLANMDEALIIISDSMLIAAKLCDLPSTISETSTLELKNVVL